jgi:hypothetical protein
MTGYEYDCSELFLDWEGNMERLDIENIKKKPVLKTQARCFVGRESCCPEYFNETSNMED